LYYHFQRRRTWFLRLVFKIKNVMLLFITRRTDARPPGRTDDTRYTIHTTTANIRAASHETRARGRVLNVVVVVVVGSKGKQRDETNQDVHAYVHSTSDHFVRYQRERIDGSD
jgi:hypothetical protein